MYETNPGELAHLVERRFCKPEAIGSTPIFSTNHCGYDVMVAYLLAMQDARVRFSLPAPVSLGVVK